MRLTPDDWMIPLFGESMANGKRNVLEGRLLWLAREALRLDIDVVLDFGCWARVERDAIHWLAEDAGGKYQLVYLSVDQDVQRERVALRQAATPEQTFPMTDDELVRWRAQFEEPDAGELDGVEVGDPPVGWPGWAQWAAEWWPSVL